MKRNRSLPTLANPLKIAFCSLAWDGELGFTKVTNMPMFIGATAGVPAAESVKDLGSVFSNTALLAFTSRRCHVSLTIGGRKM
jgi:hypothetical protein